MKATATDRDQLREILQAKSLRKGDFHTFIREKKLLLPRLPFDDSWILGGALLIARLILKTIREHDIKADAIGGLTLGADPDERPWP